MGETASVPLMSGTEQQALVVSHEPNGGSAVLGRALQERGWRLDEHQMTDDLAKPHQYNPLPALGGYRLLVVMGSVHSVYDRSNVGAWIDEELELLRSAHERGVPVLGVCFGAQALAAALGGGVEPSPRTEIGWYHIDGDDVPVDPGPWLQWHHDRLQPPPEAEILATTPENVQLFRLGTSVGTQFHPEVDLAHVATWLEMAPEDYLSRCGVDVGDFLAETRRWESTSAVACARLVDWFLTL